MEGTDHRPATGLRRRFNVRSESAIYPSTHTLIHSFTASLSAPESPLTSIAKSTYEALALDHCSAPHFSATELLHMLGGLCDTVSLFGSFPRKQLLLFSLVFPNKIQKAHRENLKKQHGNGYYIVKYHNIIIFNRCITQNHKHCLASLRNIFPSLS